MGAARWRQPVVAATGQITSHQGADDPLGAPDPVELMVEAVRRAAAEAGGRRLLDVVTHLWVVPPLSLRHHDPAGLVADRLGLAGVEARCGGMGGNVPQWLVNRAAELVLAGARPCVVIVGGEALATRRAARRLGRHLDWPADGGFPTLWPELEADMGVHPVERAHGLSAATASYALIESALARRRHLDPAAHRRAMGTLMAPCSEVAAKNPYAWFPTARTPDELVTVTPANRMICHPYPKLLNAVLDVDMAAAVVVTDSRRASELGLGPGEVAHVAAWAQATEVWHVAARPDPSRAPALAAAAAGALQAAGLDADQVGLYDLYGCFPSALAVAAESIGVGDRDVLTATGALPYHGGPGSNYTTHAIANVVHALRAGTAASALVHGNGYYLTKHAIGIYTSAPGPAEPSAHRDPPEPASSGPELTVVHGPDGSEPGTVVAATVPFDRDGRPSPGVVLAELAGGRRTVARADEELTTAILADQAVGAAVVLRDDTTAQTATDPGSPAGTERQPGNLACLA